MYDRPRNRKLARSGRPKHSRERTPPPRLRSPSPRDRNRPRFERTRSRERLRRSRDRSPRFQRTRSKERYELLAPHDPATFESPISQPVNHSRSFEGDRYMSSTPRFNDRVDMEPVMVERNMNFDCPVDYDKFPERYGERPARNMEMDQNPIQIDPREESPPFIVDKVDESDKPDPWGCATVPSTSSVPLLPTFGQEKGSNLIPEFDPDISDHNCNAFLKLIDKIGDEKNWPGSDRKLQFSTKLRGAAREWFINGNKFLESWSSIKRQFKTTFPADMDYYFNLTNMLQRTKKPDEDLSTYFNYKIILLRNCNITGRKAVSCLIGGLPDLLKNIKDTALDKNFATPEELYKFLIDQNVDVSNNEQKCNVCGQRDNLNCHKNEMKQPLLVEESRLKPMKCYKDVYIQGKRLKCLFDEGFPNNTIKESDVDFLKIRYKRQITLINGYERATITALGITQIMIRIDDLFAEMPFYVIKDNIQDIAVVLGQGAIKYPHVTNRNGIFFTADSKSTVPEELHHDAIEAGKSRSPFPMRRNQQEYAFSGRRSPGNRGINRSPPRRSSPGRLYKDSSVFVNQFYGNPYA